MGHFRVLFVKKLAHSRTFNRKLCRQNVERNEWQWWFQKKKKTSTQLWFEWKCYYLCFDMDDISGGFCGKLLWVCDGRKSMDDKFKWRQYLGRKLWFQINVLKIRAVLLLDQVARSVAMFALREMHELRHFWSNSHKNFRNNAHHEFNQHSLSHISSVESRTVSEK